MLPPVLYDVKVVSLESVQQQQQQQQQRRRPQQQQQQQQQQQRQQRPLRLLEHLPLNTSASLAEVALGQSSGFRV